MLKKIIAVAFIIPILLAAKANNGCQNETTISGVVFDTKTKKPVMGVTVTAIVSKAIVHDKDQTNKSGNFLIEGNTTSEVTLIFEKRGFKTVRKEGIKMKQGECLNLTIEMISQVEDDGETEELYPNDFFSNNLIKTS